MLLDHYNTIQDSHTFNYSLLDHFQIFALFVVSLFLVHLLYEKWRRNNTQSYVSLSKQLITHAYIINVRKRSGIGLDWHRLNKWHYTHKNTLSDNLMPYRAAGRFSHYWLDLLFSNYAINAQNEKNIGIRYNQYHFYLLAYSWNNTILFYRIQPNILCVFGK